MSMIEEQLPLFGENIMELAEDSKLYIWYNNSDGDSELHCNVLSVCDTENSITFRVINGAWEGKLYPYKKLIKVGLWEDAPFQIISKFEFYDKNYFKCMNKLQGIEEVNFDTFDNDIPF